MPPLPLRASGNQLFDTAGTPFVIKGVSWFGLETPALIPHGLDFYRGCRESFDQIRALGFNTVRLPFCNQALVPGTMPPNVHAALNPDMVCKDTLTILDRIVEHATAAGVRLILDRHRASIGGGPEASGLWYTPAYSEARWIDDWKMLAHRYMGNPTIIGADIHNEPHAPDNFSGARWGNGDPATDWKAAAERCAMAILNTGSDWLIFVEGTSYSPFSANPQWTWWGGNLTEAMFMPAAIQANRLVYSPHDYPQSVYNQDWFSAPNFPNNMPALWNHFWGNLHHNGTAPILLGEFGSRLLTLKDQQWGAKLVSYLAGGGTSMNWVWWSWNPDSGDTGGILKDDWQTPHPEKLLLLAPLL
jgi:aryl-phospho-beta-D-glucosidase BglC (GH1 family)